jgi:hypothetical protein
VLSHGAATLIFHFAVRSHAKLSSINHSTRAAGEKHRLSILWKGFILVSVLTVVIDAMTMAGTVFIFGNVVGTRHFVSVVFLAIRAVALLVPLTVACCSLNDELHESTNAVGVGGGVDIFAVTLGDAVFNPACSLGQWISGAGAAAGAAAACIPIKRLTSAEAPSKVQGMMLGSTKRTVSPRHVSRLLNSYDNK